MARLNKPSQNTTFTHEGGPAIAPRSSLHELRRAVMSCLLWEDTFYESGEDIANRIAKLSHEASCEEVQALAVEARKRFGLRHAPLWLTMSLLSHPQRGENLRFTIANVIQRVDEIPEMIAMYWKDGRKPLPSQLKKGLASAFGQFDEYQLAKYNRDNAIRLRDVLRLVHPKPVNAEQSALWKRVIDGTLAKPDTWEVNLSGGKAKKETWDRLLTEEKLGYLALLRNLRNMEKANVDRDLIKKAILARKGSRWVFPFRYVAAARAAPSLEPELDQALQAAIKDLPRLPGKTAVLVDVSGSMNHALSFKSDLTRMDAAAALASVINAEDLRVFSFSYNLVEVPPRRGMAGVQAIVGSQEHGGTNLGGALEALNRLFKYDRVIVITDEQAHDTVGGPLPGAKGYMINVASYRNGVGYGAWTRIDGFSENVIRYMAEAEGLMEGPQISSQPTVELECADTE